MASADLDGPLQDFYERTAELRRIVGSIEALGRDPTVVMSTRPGVDLPGVGPVTINTANAMSMVFLASSFEEFVRDEIGQCAGYLTEKYVALSDDLRHSIRNSYWGVWLSRVKLHGSILTKSKPRIPDSSALSAIQPLLESATGFVVNDDVSSFQRTLFSHHSSNFKPDVVDEIAQRIGVKTLIASAADSAAMRSHFGTTTKNETAERLRTKLSEFYDRRNQIVHSLSSATGYGTEVVFGYVELLELTADGIKTALGKSIARW